MAGKYADFIAAAGNPLEDIRAVYQVVAVAKVGCLLLHANREGVPDWTTAI